MHIRDLTVSTTGSARNYSATIAWEENEFPEQALCFTITDGEGRDAGEPSADAFLAACFPLAAVHGEARVRIDGEPCPMLIEGLRTVHAWWASWGGMLTPAPEIEGRPRTRGKTWSEPRAVACISGGVDGLHMLMRNRQLYRPDDPAYIRDALFIHGFDIGKRARDPEEERYQMALRRLEPIANETGLRIIACRTNLRQLPTQPGFWAYRHHGAALAAVGHAATTGASAYFFIGGSYVVATPVPWGSHPAVDGLFSSQRVKVIHDGSRFARLDKVRDLAKWPTALDSLRVCSANLGSEANCGRCEKCLRTRLELLAAGVEESAALGRSFTSPKLWEAAIQGPVGDPALMYADLLVPLRALGLRDICQLLDDLIAAYRKRAQSGERWPAGRGDSGPGR
jgi:hypothetical protein